MLHASNNPSKIGIRVKNSLYPYEVIISTHMHGDRGMVGYAYERGMACYLPAYVL